MPPSEETGTHLYTLRGPEDQFQELPFYIIEQQSYKSNSIPILPSMFTAKLASRRSKVTLKMASTCL
jgi:hypothetical protein